ncbi:hypothetical protein F5Y15DRAFT_423888 [Xylariaceae sp. FL0016]|nr:hypothetical protein F5Y15DRAFT_423888 [Xylariaceae sp. FL0016]
MSNSASNRRSVGQWSFADPYTYQYDDVANEEIQASLAAGSVVPCELEGSFSHSAGAMSNIHLDNCNTPRPGLPELDAGVQRQSSSLNRARCTNGRGSVRASHHRRVATAEPSTQPRITVVPPPVTRDPRFQAAGNGLIPVRKEMAPSSPAHRSQPTSPVSGHRSHHRFSQQQCHDGLLSISEVVPKPAHEGLTSADELRPRSCDEGLMPVQESMPVSPMTPTSPASDFDSILANIEPSKKVGSTWKMRSNRRYDRYSQNYA